MLSNPYVFSTEQSRILDRLGSLTNITFMDDRLAAHTIALSIYRELAKGKCNIVVTERLEIKTMIWESLRDLGIHHMALECDLRDTIIESDIESWKEWMQAKYTSPDEAYQDAKFKFDILDRSIKSYYSTQQKNENHQFVTDRVLEKYWMLPADFSLDNLLVELNIAGLDFDLPTYKLLLAQIEEATYHYQSGFELINDRPYAETIDKANGVVSDIHDLSYTIFGLIERANSIHEQYTKAILDIKESYQLKLYEQMTEIVQSIDYLAHKSRILNQKLDKAKQKKSVISLFRSEDSSISILKANIDDNIQLIRDFFVSNKCGDINVTLDSLIKSDESWYDNLKSKLKVYEDNIPRKVADYLKSINKLNATAPELQYLETEFDVLLSHINETNAFDDILELNTLSLLKQYNYVSHVVKELKLKALHIDIHLPYYQWMNKLAEMDARTVAVIDALRAYEIDKWLEIFNRWYYHQVLYKQSYNLHHIDTGQLSDASFLHMQIQELEAQILMYTLHQLPTEAEKRQLKTAFPSLYQAVFKHGKSKEAIMWKHLLENATGFVAKKYPILILDSDDLGSIDTNAYTSIFYIGVSNINPDLLHFFTSIHTYISYNQQDRIKTDLTLSTFAITNNTRSDLSTTQRIILARQLTTMLLTLDESPKIYQLRRNGVIFFGKEFIARRLEKELYDYGIKQVIVGDSIEETLFATWLNADHPPIIIIENHLINGDRNEDYLWQLQVIEFLKSNGATVLDLHINKNWKHGVKDVVGSVIVSVKEANGPFRASKNQLSIEF